MEVEKDELAQELVTLRAEHATLVKRQGPDVGGGRKRGRFDAGPWQMRALVWGELARRTPPTAVGPNVVDAAQLLAPGANVREPHFKQIRKMRAEMGLAGQAMAAAQFASCQHVLCSGFDETSKQQTGLLSTNFQCVKEDGAVHNVVLQGVVIIPGGTAEQVASAVETRVLGRARERVCRAGRTCTSSSTAPARGLGPTPRTSGCTGSRARSS